MPLRSALRVAGNTLLRTSAAPSPCPSGCERLVAQSTSASNDLPTLQVGLNLLKNALWGNPAAATGEAKVTNTKRRGQDGLEAAPESASTGGDDTTNARVGSILRQLVATSCVGLVQQLVALGGAFSSIEEIEGIRRRTHPGLDFSAVHHRLRSLRCEQLQQCSPAAAVSTAKALVLLRWKPHAGLVAALCTAIEQDISAAGTAGLSDFVQGLERLGCVPENEFLDEVGRAVSASLWASKVGEVGGVRAESVARLVVAFSRFGHRHEVLLDACAQYLKSRVEQLSNGALTTLTRVYALGWRTTGTTMPRLRSQLLDNVVQEAVLRQPSQFSASELSTFVHSLASLHHEDILSSTAMDLCTLSAIRRSEQFRAHEMVDVVWSYTQIFGHHHDPQVLDTMAKLLVPRLGEITHVPRLVILVKAFADLDLHYTDLHNEVSALLCPHLECLDQGLVVELLQAFGHVHHYSSTLFERAATVLSDSKSRLSTSQLASVLQLYGCMMHDPGQAALDVWLTQLQDLGRAALTSSQVCSVLWSLALLEALSPELFLQLSRDIQDCRKGDFTVSDIERLLMAEWLLEITCRRQGQTPPRIPRPLRLQILSVWRERLYYKHDVSSFQKDVGLTLTDMRISHTLEESVENGDFKIDYVIVGDGNARVALECDGPRRFTSNAPYHALGETVASRRVLEGRGWRVVSISKHAWNSLKSREEKQSFLEQELWGIGC